MYIVVFGRQGQLGQCSPLLQQGLSSLAGQGSEGGDNKAEARQDPREEDLHHRGGVVQRPSHGVHPLLELLQELGLLRATGLPVFEAPVQGSLPEASLRVR